MDTKLIGKNTTLYLPVFIEKAYLLKTSPFRAG